MGYKTTKKKTRKLSFIERAQVIPQTLRDLESFLGSQNKVYI